VQSPANVSIQAAAMGPGHCVLVAADGAVYGCGKCDQGQLPGVTGTSPVLTPVLLDTPFTLLAGASTDVSPGDSPTHSCPSHDSEGGEVNGLSTGDYSDLDETAAGASAATPCEDDHNAANPSLLSNAELDTAASTDGCLLDSDAAPARAHVCLHQLVCGVNCTCFVTRGPRDVSRQRQPDLRASLQAAVAAAQAAYIQRLRKHSRRGASLASALRTVASGVEQVMSCPSALVAAWRVRVGKRKGLDLLALDEVLQAIFALTAATTTPARVNDPAMEVVTRPDLYPAGELSPAHSSSCTTECSEPQGGEAGCGLGGQEVSNGEQVVEVDRVQQNRLAQVLLRAFSSLVDELGAHTELLVDVDRAQLLLAALHCPLLMQHAAAKQLLPRLCFSIIHAPESGQQELTATKKLTTSIMAVIRVLALIEEANQIGRQLPPEAFYNQLISAGSQGSAQESSEAEKRRSPGPHGLRSLMSALQQGTSRLLRGVTASGAAEDRGHARELPPPEPFSTRRDLYKPLRVHFIGEDGIDAGGVKKEFFQILVAELLNPDYGLLQVQESNTFWFCPSALETPDRYLLLGLVLGLAVYNRVLLDFALPLVAYKKLLGQPVDLRDLEDMQPTVGRSLRQLLA
ncbi:ubiquitin-protein ligase E3 A, partial [Haematococcus lacustris]